MVENKGISPVIGVILMVGVVIALVILVSVTVLDIGSINSTDQDTSPVIKLDSSSSSIELNIIETGNSDEFIINGPDGKIDEFDSKTGVNKEYNNLDAGKYSIISQSNKDSVVIRTIDVNATYRFAGSININPPLEGVKVSLRDNKTGKTVDSSLTDSIGEFKFTSKKSDHKLFVSGIKANSISKRDGLSLNIDDLIYEEKIRENNFSGIPIEISTPSSYPNVSSRTYTGSNGKFNITSQESGNLYINGSIVTSYKSKSYSSNEIFDGVIFNEVMGDNINNYVRSKVMKGSGSSSDPYKIEEASDLIIMKLTASDDTLTYYELVNNINGSHTKNTNYNRLQEDTVNVKNADAEVGDVIYVDRKITEIGSPEGNNADNDFKLTENNNIKRVNSTEENPVISINLERPINLGLDIDTDGGIYNLDGNGHTINNVRVVGGSVLPPINNGAVTNLTIDGAEIETYSRGIEEDNAENISLLSVENPLPSGVLFRSSVNADISNITIKNTSIQSSSRLTGGISGYNYGSNVQNITIKDTRINGNVCVGSLFGTVYGTYIDGIDLQGNSGIDYQSVPTQISNVSINGVGINNPSVDIHDSSIDNEIYDLCA